MFEIAPNEIRKKDRCIRGELGMALRTICGMRWHSWYFRFTVCKLSTYVMQASIQLFRHNILKNCSQWEEKITLLLRGSDRFMEVYGGGS